MSVTSNVDRVTFAGGESGPQLAARADTAKYQISVEAIENYIVMKGGGVTRAPGTRFVLELKNQVERGRLIPFRRTSTDYLMLVLNGGASRFVRQGGFVQNDDTTPYEMAVPWVEAELAGLRAASAGNSIFVASGTQDPQVITRAGARSWSCADYAPATGPVDSQNVDVSVTVRASATTGNVNLTGTGSPFASDMVGGVMRLDDRDFSTTPEWLTTETAIALNAQRRWNGNVYQAMVASADAGPNPPLHTSGDVSAGNGKQTWRYLHSNYGYVRINGVTDANTATGTVLSRLPDNVTLSGGTYRWSPPAWTLSKGFPDLVAYDYPRLNWYRGNTYWMTGDADAQNFDLGQAGDTDAIAGRVIPPDGSLVEIKWALPSGGVLLLGASDGEWSLRGASPYDAMTPRTTRPFLLGSDGSAPQVAIPVDGGVMFLGVTQKRLHYTKHDAQQQQLDSDEISLIAEHIFAKKMVGGCWQRDPNRVFWMWFEDGSLASCTFMKAQKIVAFCRHPRRNMFVEDIACIPSVSSGTDEVYLIVRRTINGQTRRYVEQMAEYFEPADIAAPTAAGAWFLDCALRITSVAGIETVTQLAHLEGQEVGVFADGAMQARKTVAGGSIDLDRKSNDILIGIPVRGYIRDLPRNFDARTGSTTGKQKTIHEASVQMLYSGGGQVRVYDREEDNPERWEDVNETGAQDYDGMPALFTGKKRLTLEGGWADEAQLEFQCDDALPSTVLALSPKIEVVES